LTTHRTTTPFRIERDDAGKPDDSTDANDCVVIAVAHVLGVHYTRSHDLLATHGREFGCGTQDAIWKAALDDLGVSYTPLGTGLADLLLGGRSRIGPFTREHPAGRFLVSLGILYDNLPHHLIAVIDGVVYDANWNWLCEEPWRYAGRRLTHAWHIVDTQPDRMLQ